MMTGNAVKGELKRELGLFETTLYGVGIILGAGIYALIGKGAGLAGNALWISFFIAAVIAAFTGLSYAELSSMYPKAAAEYNYTLNAFRMKRLSVIVGLFLVASGTIGAAAVSLGFAGYFSYLFGGSDLLIAGALVLVLTLVNYIGIKESSRFNVVATLIEAGGLVLVVVIGFFFFSGSNIDFFETATPGFSGIITATALIFFAFIGFENVANISEEAKNPAVVVPKALILSIIISTVLYVLVAVAAVSILGWERLSLSGAPLTEAVSEAIPGAGIFMSVIALFATSNTVLIMLIVSSRVLYGISADNSLPVFLSRVGRRGTPYNAIILAGVAAIAALFMGDIETVAMITNLGTFVVYFFVNMSLITLRYKKPKLERPFRTPLNIGRFPVIAFLGATSCVVMIYFILVYFAR
ncbi:MAG: amino acid permease [archaeon]